MRRVFADTSYWIALVNPRDQLHAKAVSVTQQLFSVRVLTSEMVLTEVLNSFSDSGPLRRAVRSMVERLQSNRDVIIVPQTSQQFENALRRYKPSDAPLWYALLILAVYLGICYVILRYLEKRKLFLRL